MSGDQPASLSSCFLMRVPEDLSEFVERADAKVFSAVVNNPREKRSLNPDRNPITINKLVFSAESAAVWWMLKFMIFDAKRDAVIAAKTPPTTGSVAPVSLRNVRDRPR